MPSPTIGFRPTDEDRQLLDKLARDGVSTTDALRPLRLVAHEQWLDKARVDAERLGSENLNDEPDAW
jgi:hypothetical protein